VTDEVGTSGNWNLPNVLTGVRIVIVPFFGVALLHDGGDSILWRTVAAVLFIAAMITDKVDGDIARARGLVTNFGAVAEGKDREFNSQLFADVGAHGLPFLRFHRFDTQFSRRVAAHDLRHVLFRQG
jgi:hypothetical protein